MASKGWRVAGASSDPEAAIDWAMGLPNDAQRTSALSSAAGAWAQADPHEAAAWVDTLPAGASRDGAAQALVYALNRQQPEDRLGLGVKHRGSREQDVRAADGVSNDAEQGSCDRGSDAAKQRPSPEQIKTLKASPNLGGRFINTF
jgi:hypothetical protein